MTTDVLLHYDTLALSGDAALLGLGACFFDLEDEAKEAEPVFYCVAIDGQEELGRRIHANSLDWWRTDAPYTHPLTAPRWTLEEAFTRSMQLIAVSCDQPRVWVWNAMLEGAITQSLLDLFAVRAPWRYWDVWEARTYGAILSSYDDVCEVPAPTGLSPQHQMQERARFIRGCHAEVNMAFARTLRAVR